jgi:uncharacterized protein with FMN-binding domain
VRKATKNIVGVLSLGVLATSWSIGQAAESGLVVGATNAATNAATPEPSASASSEPSASSQANAQSNTQPSASASAKPTPTKTATSAAKSVTKKSDSISYVAEKRQGVMQISVTKQGSTITAINILSGGTEGGQWATVPDLLAQAAIDAQGSDFGNISRATHTTEAFKTALETALAKF